MPTPRWIQNGRIPWSRPVGWEAATSGVSQVMAVRGLHHGDPGGEAGRAMDSKRTGRGMDDGLGKATALTRGASTRVERTGLGRTKDIEAIRDKDGVREFRVHVTIRDKVMAIGDGRHRPLRSHRRLAVLTDMATRHLEKSHRWGMIFVRGDQDTRARWASTPRARSAALTRRSLEPRRERAIGIGGGPSSFGWEEKAIKFQKSTSAPE